MRKVFFWLLAAFLALVAGAAIPTDADDWYTPSGGFKRTVGEGSLVYYDSDGQRHTETVTVDDSGNVSGGWLVFDDAALQTAFNALVIACSEQAYNEIQDQKIAEIGKNLDSVFRADGIQMQIEKQGPGGGTRKVMYTMRIATGSGGGPATIEVEDPIQYGRIVDDKTIAWTAENETGQLMVKGALTAQPGQVPHSDGDGGILWDWPLSGLVFDNVTVTTNDTGKAHLVGWADDTQKCDTDLTTILTSDTSQGELNRLNHAVLTRFGTGRNAVFHYVPIGDRLSAGSEVDGMSITTNEIDGALLQGVASLYGWADEVEDGAETLTQMLSDGSGEGRDTHYVLARVGTGVDAVLGYVPIGEGLDGVTWATNWTEAIKGIAASEAERIVNWNTNWVVLAGDIASSQELMREYVDNTLNWTTNWYASTQDMNASADSIRQYIDGQLDIITNQIAGINGVIASENTNIQTVNQYIQTVLAMQTNFITGVEMAQLNGTVESMKDYIDETFDILTNQIVGIKGVIESGDFTDLQTVGDYVQKEIGIQTNEMVAIMTALDNGVAESVTELVEYKYDILTNEIAGIMGVIESDVVTVDSVGDYIKKVINIQTNVIVHEAFVTNFINTFEMVENWTYVTNYIVRYLGVTDSGGGHGGEEEGPTIAPEDDPYSGEYEPQDMDDFLLPVKNARNIVSITNEPLSEIESTHLLDFMSIDTNKEHLVQLKGFDEADDESIPVKRRGANADEYKLEWMSSPVTLLQITTNSIAEIKNWMTRNSVSNIFSTVITNAEAVATMRTNIFAHVKAETMLDDDSVFTNGARKVEIKGYKEAEAFTVPFANRNSDAYYQGKEHVLTWEKLPFADSAAGEYSGNATISQSIEANLVGTMDDPPRTIKALSIYGFNDASNGQIPMKVQPLGAPGSVVWTNVPSAKWTGSFSYFDGQIHDGCVVVGRQAISVSGVQATSGNYRVKVTLGANPTAVIEQGSGFASPSGNVSYIPIYYLVDGEIQADYRGSFVVPSWE